MAGVTAHSRGHTNAAESLEPECEIQHGVVVRLGNVGTPVAGREIHGDGPDQRCKDYDYGRETEMRHPPPRRSPPEWSALQKEHELYAT